MSSRLFQGIIQQMKDSVERTIGIIDENGVIIACSDLSRMGHGGNDIISEISYGPDVLIIDGITYKAIGSHIKPEYVLFVSGTDDTATELANALSISLGAVKEYYDEKYDKTNFIKNVILDNIMPGDIYIKARELRLVNEVNRAVLLIHLIDRTDIMAIDIIQSLFPEKQKDYIISINESDIVLVKEVKHNIDSKDLEKLAKSIVDTLNAEFYTKSSIGIGTVVSTIKDLPRSFKEAQVALEVGKVFDIEKNIMSYDNLGIGRLIYQLPTTLCEMFLTEIFKKGSIDSLDHETLFTIQKFFENNLNVSETSRKLFVHRNTLVYRLEKIKRITGLDLREFDHAIVFKVALMVKKYLDSKPVKY